MIREPAPGTKVDVAIGGGGGGNCGCDGGGGGRESAFCAVCLFDLPPPPLSLDSSPMLTLRLTTSLYSLPCSLASSSASFNASSNDSEAPIDRRSSGLSGTGWKAPRAPERGKWGRVQRRVIGAEEEEGAENWEEVERARKSTATRDMHRNMMEQPRRRGEEQKMRYGIDLCAP